MTVNGTEIKTDRAAYAILNRFHKDLCAAIDTLMKSAKDFEERETIVGLVCGAVRHSATELDPKATNDTERNER